MTASVLFLLTLLGGLGLGWALEVHLSDPLHRGAPAAPQRDPAGRGLYLLVIDSLSPRDVPELPSLMEMQAQGFSAAVEPCRDNFTIPCVHEALTGRPTFSLFSFLDNMGVMERALGDNLLGDARAAGLRTAVLHRKDLKGWPGQADSTRKIPETKRIYERAWGVEAAAAHDVVLHHYVWHDVVAHMNPEGSEAYVESLEELSRFLTGLRADLPEHMDLLITGDHGHTPDGRHLQGLDTPTELLVLSPRVRPGRPEGRVPITAVRYLAGLVSGLGTQGARVEADWQDWAAPDVSEAVRTAGAPADGVRADLGLPWMALGLALGLGGLGLWAVGAKGGLVAGLWAVLLGLSYPFLHQLNLAGGGPRAWFWITPLWPLLVGALALWRTRAMAGVWLWVALGSVAFWIGLYPTLGGEGVLRNAETLLMPPLICAGGVGLWLALRVRSAAERPRWWWLAPAIALLAAVAVLWTGSFRANDVKVLAWPIGSWPYHWPLVASLASGVVVAGLQAICRPHPLALVLAFGLTAFGAALPGPLQVAGFVGLTLVLLGARGRVRLYLALPLAGLVSAVALSPRRQLGMVFGVLVLAAGARAAVHIAQRVGSKDARRALRWTLAMFVAVGAYLGLAWTISLHVAGIKFGFALRWMHGDWHERLWWLIALGVVLKGFVPLVLFVETLRPHVQMRSVLQLAVRLSALRYVAGALFSTGWVVAQGPSVATRRLLRVLQDGYGWLFVAAVVLVLAAAPLWGRRPKPSAA